MGLNERCPYTYVISSHIETNVVTVSVISAVH